MRIITVATGSHDGNCYLVDYGCGYLALDCGCNWKKVQIACGFQPSLIEAAFVSHEHTDHSAYYKDFLRNGITVYADDRVAHRLMEVNGEYIRCLPLNKQVRIKGGCLVIPFAIPHEDIPNAAFLIQFPNGDRLLYATDFQYVPFNLASWNIDHFLISVNHSMEIPEDANAREHRLRGHASLQTVKDFLKTSMTDRCKNVIVCHISEQYGDKNVIKNELQELCGDKVKVSIARKGETINL